MNYWGKVLLLILLNHLPIYSYIYELKVFRGWHAALGCYQYIIGLSDFHDKKHPINKQQHDYLLSILSRCPTCNMKVIVEDISSHDNKGRKLCGKFFVDSRGGILGGLAQQCKMLGLDDIDNVEFRYCRVTSLGPVLDNTTISAATFPSTSSIKVNSLLQEIDAVVDEVKTYTDGPFLQKYYTGTINDIGQALKQLDIHAFDQLSVADYVDSKSSAQDRFPFLKKLLTFDSSLLDSKIIHSICTTNTKPTIILVAGGAHIDRVAELLQKLGFEFIFASKTSLVKEYDLSKCFGCTAVNGQFCLKPEPLDITLLEQFL